MAPRTKERKEREAFDDDGNYSIGDMQQLTPGEPSDDERSDNGELPDGTAGTPAWRASSAAVSRARDTIQVPLSNPDAHERTGPNTIPLRTGDVGPAPVPNPPRDTDWLHESIGRLLTLRRSRAPEEEIAQAEEEVHYLCSLFGYSPAVPQPQAGWVPAYRQPPAQSAEE
ncbi:hypothetical protein K469DRAFT_697238 [Zopfia rhizophila CBS 207.26]|uniref:Uncharacterized protein n=1 Tax=Zopfia rhizophila CBS 207.26 TaxID=1314779 RepID=A0A6A6EJT8_9PEZI|nr:hypothetical protein K469DRAFT_697237 [Zopfia rhizophila CBS 207.26]KAF2191601.1 hypothetical protein K469DRAFT_697238 [Zopfia rhizophila CBS 207.26]